MADIKSRKIDKGRSVLNAADEAANPYGLVLSEKEREFIYGGLNRLDNRTDAILNGKKGWKQQAQATFESVMDFGLAGLIALGLHYFISVSVGPALIAGLVFVVLQKLNLLLTREKIEDTHNRQLREEKKEADERAQYFKDMGVKDIAIEE